MKESMRRRLHILAMFTLLLSAPLGAWAQSEGEDVEAELHTITLSIDGARVHVDGAEGKVLEVYNLTGIKVATIRIDNDSKQVNLDNLSRGYYILKVGDVVRKVSIR